MFESISRRGFLGLAPVVPFAFQTQSAAPPTVTAVPARFPPRTPTSSRRWSACRTGTCRALKELVSARPALARASWDWGFGDWETAIDAASHVGNRPIAEYLIANGARPTIYTAAMMGQLAIVKGWIEAIPGVQRNRGPHGITLLAHARNGGAARGRGAEVSRVARRRRPALHGPAGRRGGSGRHRRRVRLRDRRDGAAQGREERARHPHDPAARLLRAQPGAPGRPGVHSGRRRGRPDPIRGRRRQSAVADGRGWAARRGPRDARSSRYTPRVFLLEE